MFKQVMAAMILVLPLAVYAQSADLCDGDAVTTGERYNGVIEQVFPDGIAKVRLTDGRYAGQTYEYVTRDLSKPIACFGEICTNSAITTGERYNGVIEQVFPDGIAKVRLTDGRYSGQIYEYVIRDLSLTKSCYGDLCAGDMITTGERYNGVIKQVFPGGIAKVLITDGRYSGQIYEYVTRDLSLKRKCSPSVGSDCRR